MNMLVVGNDKIAQRLLAELGDVSNLLIVMDRSNSLGRVVRLLRRGTLRLSDIFKMGLAEWRRPAFPGTASRIAASVTSNAELIELIRTHRPQRIYLFRAGLIINRAVLAEGVEVLNFHSASIRTHGGLASIRRALDDNVLEQAATLHRVTSRIDEGEIIAEQPYRLDRGKSYFCNEQTAYAAGITLALAVLRDRPETQEAGPGNWNEA